MKKRFFAALFLAVLLICTAPVNTLAAEEVPYPEGSRDLWLPEGESPQPAPAENCRWALTGESRQEQNRICEKQEHSHITSCPRDDAGSYLCACHTEHGESCYVTTYPACQEHVHTESCGAAPVYDCGLEETAGHGHTDACFVLNCGAEEAEHVHTEACYSEICGLSAGAGAHTHEGCTQVDTLYACGLAEHTHTETCSAQTRLVCGFETLQQHVDDGCAADCALEAHTHDESCYALETWLEWQVVPTVLKTATVAVFYRDGETDVPLPGAAVTLTAADGSLLTATADETGTAVFADLPEGTYTAAAVLEEDIFRYSAESLTLQADWAGTAFSLEVQRQRKETGLTVSLTVERTLNGEKQASDFRMAGYEEPRSFTFAITLTDPEGRDEEPFEKTIRLGNEDPEDDTIRLSLPRGYGYKVAQKAGAFQMQLYKASGTVGTTPIAVSAVNTFHYYLADADDSDNALRDTLCLGFLVTDPEGVPLEGAALLAKGEGEIPFRDAGGGAHHLCIDGPGTYILTQSTAPKGYLRDATRYKLTVNSRFEKQYITLDGNQVPAIVEKLSADSANSTMPAETDGIYQLENQIQLIDVKVSLRWRIFGDIGQPASAKVGLYRDGKLVDTQFLEAGTGWTCTWEDLPAIYDYEVDMLDVPSGFGKTVRQTIANKWTITASAYNIPATADGFPLQLWLGILGLSAALLTVLWFRKRRTA